MSREVEILRSRVKLLVGRVRPYKEDLATMAEHAHAKCEEWMRTRWALPLLSCFD